MGNARITLERGNRIDFTGELGIGWDINKRDLMCGKNGIEEKSAERDG